VKTGTHQPEQGGGLEMNQNDFADLVFKAIDAAWLATTEKLNGSDGPSSKNGELHSELSEHWLEQLGVSLCALARQTRPHAQLSRRGQPSEFLFDLVFMIPKAALNTPASAFGPSRANLRSGIGMSYEIWQNCYGPMSKTGFSFAVKLQA
jgi:hypothetical protein